MNRKTLLNIFGISFITLLTAMVVAQNNPIVIEKPWSQAMPEVAITGAAYMTLKNTGSQADQVVEAISDVAEHVELHTHVMHQGMMQMRPVKGIDLPAGGTVILEPMGLHLMLINLKRPLKDGEKITLTLRFANASEITLEVPVQSSAPRV